MNPIVGIGELLWDVYPDGRKVAGGAPFNFAFHCHQLGHPAVIVSRVGDDNLGRELREEVRRLGLSDEYIQTDREHPTGTVRVTLDEHKVPTYTITENVAWDNIEWDVRVEKLAAEVAAVCFGTLALRCVGAAQMIYRFLDTTRIAAPRALRVFDVNIRQGYYRPDTIANCLGRATWFKLNEDEFWILKSMNGAHQDDPEIFLYSIFAYGPRGDRYQILTRGGEGCEIYSEAERLHVPAVPARVVDTVGAGDAFTAAMVCLHLEGRPLRDCARFANHYAARVCEHHGATPRIDRAEVERAAVGYDQPPS